MDDFPVDRDIEGTPTESNLLRTSFAEAAQHLQRERKSRRLQATMWKSWRPSACEYQSSFFCIQQLQHSHKKRPVQSDGRGEIVIIIMNCLLSLLPSVHGDTGHLHGSHGQRTSKVHNKLNSRQTVPFQIQ